MPEDAFLVERSEGFGAAGIRFRYDPQAGRPRPPGASTSPADAPGIGFATLLLGSEIGFARACARLVTRPRLRAPHETPERREFSRSPHRSQREFCERL